MTTAPRSCFCGCGQTFKRSRSFPLCKAATARAYEAMKAIPLADEFNAAARRSNRFWSNAQTVATAVATA